VGDRDFTGHCGVTSPPVAIIGGSGTVGRLLAMRLLRAGIAVRLGGRGEVDGRALATALGDGAAWQTVDVYDEQSLKAFCAGSQVVVGLVAPIQETGRRVARVAFANNAHYVDTASFQSTGVRASNRVSLLGAGLYPGLSGLLPRLLAARFERCDSLTAYVGGVDTLAPAAAIDYLAALDLPRDAMNPRGTVASRDLSADDVSLPFFPRPVSIRSYQTDEGERVAASLGLEEARWFSVFDGRRVLEALPVAHAARDPLSLVHAARLDAFGREPYQILLLIMRGWRDGSPATDTLLLHGSSAAALTACAATVAVRAILESAAPCGEHHFADVIVPSRAAELLGLDHDAVRAFEVLPDTAVTCEEGVL